MDQMLFYSLNLFYELFYIYIYTNEDGCQDLWKDTRKCYTVNELSIEKVIILQMSKILVAMKVTLCVKSTLIYCQERATCRSFLIFLSPVTREWSEPVKRTSDKFIFESIQIFRSQYHPNLKIVAHLEQANPFRLKPITPVTPYRG